MKILMTGANGQVATEIVYLNKKNQQCEIIALDRAQLDIIDSEAISRAISKHTPDIIVNTAAYTAVDKAEEEPEKATQINADAVRNLASLCAEKNIPLIHFSTDYVFDGKNTKPYEESDEPAPLNVYGSSKWQGEQYIRAILPKHIIIRVSSIFSVHGHNFVKTILRLVQEKESLNIVSDQRMCPTAAADIAKVVFAILQQFDKNKTLPWGMYHFCGQGNVSWYEFTHEIIKEAKKYRNLCVRDIKPVSAETFNAKALRPKMSVLGCEKIYNTFSLPKISWRESLSQVIKELF